MPQAIALAAAAAASNALAAAGATVATQAIVASAVATTFAFAAPIAITFGAQALASSLAGRPQVPRPSDGQQEFQQAIPPRMFHYGRVKVSGPYGFFEDTAGQGRVIKHLLISSREIDAFEEQYADDKAVILDAFGNVTNAYIDGGDEKVKLENHLGTDTQAADATTLAAFPDIWTSAHQLKGIAYTAMQVDDAQATDHQKVFPNGIPAYQALIRGNKVYDPRLDSTVTGGSGAHRHATKSTWAWSDNAALCILDYITHADGYNRPVAKVDLPSFMAMADICDQLVILKAGGTEKRYRVATTVYLNEARKSVLARLLEACDGRLYPAAGGKIAIRGGAWVAPAVTLDADAGQIVEMEFADGDSAMNRYNELAIKYMSPAHGYSEVEADPWRDAALVAEAGGVVETRPLDLLQVPSHGQARRLAKIRIARDNPRWVGTVRTNFYGINAVSEDKVSLAWSELNEPEGNFDGPFWLDGDRMMVSDGSGATYSVRSASSVSYDWDAATEEGTAPTVPDLILQFYTFGAGGADDFGAGGSDRLGAGT